MSFAKDDLNTEDITPNKGKLTTEAIAGAGRHDEPHPGDPSRNDLKAQSRGNGDSAHLEPLFDDRTDHDFRDRWREIQTGFVDEPRSAVERADSLVAELMQRLAQSFSEQRTNLEHQWDASDIVSTEELRVALTRYRSFFERLLSV